MPAAPPASRALRPCPLPVARGAAKRVAQARREGVRSLRQSGLIKVKQGLTSLEEVQAVTNE